MKFNIHIIIAFLAIISSSYTNATTISQSLDRYPQIEAYVGSAGKPQAPKSWTYSADGESYYAISDDGNKIIKYEIRSGKEIDTLFDITHTRDITLPDFNGYIISPDETKIMIFRESASIYRHSFKAAYYVYDIRSRILTRLSDNHAIVQSPLFSPDGRMIAFVADNNIFIKKLDYNTEVAVTTDGMYGAVINGIPDWTYEEEFATTCSMTWAPDNLTLCYLKYNETDVPLYGFELYEGACHSFSQYALYPGRFTYKYPVAGQNNSKVSIHSYDIETRKTKDITLPDKTLEYIPRIAFSPHADKLIVAGLNREQTRMELYSVNPRSTTVKSLLSEQWNAWLNPLTYENITLLHDSFVIFSSRTGYTHLYQYSYTGAMIKPITSGEYDVDAYYGYDKKQGAHYYRSLASGPLNRTICKIDSKDKIINLTPEKGTSTATFAPSMKYFVLNYNNTTTAPKYTLVNSDSGKTIRTLEDNSTYMAKYASDPKPEFFTMESDGYTLNGYMIRPENFNENKKYPVIMYQYSGPGSQEVLDRWTMGAEKYFAKAGYIVICVDGRGTGARGRAFSDVVYRQLGHYESIDQIAAANYAARLPYVDASKIAIYGWSYGGYEAIMAASQPSAPYAAAIAVAPVTDWKYYDTVYAERYMLTPQANDDGYRKSSTFTRIHTRKCPLLIMSGTADDNVHMFNSIQYIAQAESAGRWCDFLVFPNMNHSINECNSRAVVFARLLDYLENNMR
ncbi:MAG: S9 family peptidase [Paramuribaculum sp.]|nr:S9 family peptidase [Paramuribaculum sp.]